MRTSHTMPGAICQSCGMPLKRVADFGTNADGGLSHDYCGFCYQHGMFTVPDITPVGMIERCVTIMSEQHVMTEAHARALMSELIPTLKRSRVAASGWTGGVIETRH